MEILQQGDKKKGKFYIEQNGKTVAEMTFVWVNTSKIIIDHTEVDESLKGLGAGKQMVSKAVDFARENGIKIIPLCPFAKSVFDKVTTFNDVL